MGYIVKSDTHIQCMKIRQGNYHFCLLKDCSSGFGADSRPHLLFIKHMESYRGPLLPCRLQSLDLTPPACFGTCGLATLFPCSRVSGNNHPLSLGESQCFISLQE